MKKWVIWIVRLENNGGGKSCFLDDNNDNPVSAEKSSAYWACKERDRLSSSEAYTPRFGRFWFPEGDWPWSIWRGKTNIHEYWILDAYIMINASSAFSIWISIDKENILSVTCASTSQSKSLRPHEISSSVHQACISSAMSRFLAGASGAEEGHWPRLRHEDPSQSRHAGERTGEATVPLVRQRCS